MYITKGKGTFIFYKEEIPVQEHNLIIVNPNIEHTEKSETNHPLEYIALGIQGLSFSSIENPSPVTIHNYKQDQKLPLLPSAIGRRSGKPSRRLRFNYTKYSGNFIT